jgi:O-antigen/teichoic acid export membrane protein
MELTAMLVSIYLARVAWLELKEPSITAYDYRRLLSLFTQKGIYATLSVPVKKVADQLPIWFLKAMVGDIGLGAYAAARTAYSLVFAFFRSLETTLFPLVSEQAETHPERLRVALRQAQKYSFWLGLLVAMVGNATASWVVLLIAGEQYVMAIPLFRLLLWRLLIYAFSQSQRPIFYAVGEQRWLFFIYLFSTLMESGLLLAGIHFMAVTGAIWAILLNSAVFVGIRYLLILRLAPNLWVDPRGIVKVEEFDRRVWRGLERISAACIKRNTR